MWLKIIRGKYFAESRRFGAGLLSLKGGISVEFIKFRKYTYKRICEKGYFMFIYHDLIFGRVMHPKSRRRLSCAFFAKYLPLKIINKSLNKICVCETNISFLRLRLLVDGIKKEILVSYTIFERNKKLMWLKIDKNMRERDQYFFFETETFG